MRTSGRKLRYTSFAPHCLAVMQHTIRKYQDSDLPLLAKIYRAAIRHFDDGSYSKEQIAAWSSFPDDAEAFKKWITKSTTFVAVSNDNTPIAFGGLEDQGHIASLFVAPEMMRKGVGLALLVRLVEEARSRGINTITTDASEYSRPLFEKYGFRVKEIESTDFKGVKFSRYTMHMRI